MESLWISDSQAFFQHYEDQYRFINPRGDDTCYPAPVFG